MPLWHRHCWCWRQARQLSCGMGWGGWRLGLAINPVWSLQSFPALLVTIYYFMPLTCMSCWGSFLGGVKRIWRLSFFLIRNLAWPFPWCWHIHLACYPCHWSWLLPNIGWSSKEKAIKPSWFLAFLADGYIHASSHQLSQFYPPNPYMPLANTYLLHGKYSFYPVTRGRPTQFWRGKWIWKEPGIITFCFCVLCLFLPNFCFLPTTFVTTSYPLPLVSSQSLSQYVHLLSSSMHSWNVHTCSCRNLHRPCATYHLGLPLSHFLLTRKYQIRAWMSIEYGIITRNYVKNEMIIMDFCFYARNSTCHGL